MIRVIKRRANGGRRVNARIRCEEKIESICCEVLYAIEVKLSLLYALGGAES